MFTPFPVGEIRGWGSSNDAFSFRHQPMTGIENIISFISLDAPSIPVKLTELMDHTMKGHLPQNPYPNVY
jgi:hypothetical protein